MENKMMTAKEIMRDVVDTQPDDATYDEIIRELAFERMVKHGLQDIRSNKVVSNQKMKQLIKQWSN